jgi:hypothetical protein
VVASLKQETSCSSNRRGGVSETGPRAAQSPWWRLLKQETASFEIAVVASQQGRRPRCSSEIAVVASLKQGAHCGTNRRGGVSGNRETASCISGNLQVASLEREQPAQLGKSPWWRL